MELKHQDNCRIRSVWWVLIVPSGIETQEVRHRGDEELVLIVPSGIETSYDVPSREP